VRQAAGGHDCPRVALGVPPRSAAEPDRPEVVVRLPAPPDPRRARQTLTWEFAIFLGFSGLLVLAAVFATFPPRRPIGLGVLLAFTAAAGWLTSVPTGSAIGALAWPFYLGFVVNTAGWLGLRRPADALVLVSLVTAGAGAAVVRRLLNAGARSRWTRPFPAEFCPPGTLIVVVIPPSPPPLAPPLGPPAGGPARSRPGLPGRHHCHEEHRDVSTDGRPCLPGPG
jgi:hypothetical protein